jgi:hypothetical protein
MSVPDKVAPTKRPASHKWALFVFMAVAATNIMLNFMGNLDVFGVVVTIAGLAAFFASLLSARSRNTYMLGVITLVLICLRSIQSLWFDIVAYRGDLFHAPQYVTLPTIIFVVVVVVLLFLLLRAYTFGAPSRQYYGLPANRNSRSA